MSDDTSPSVALAPNTHSSSKLPIIPLPLLLFFPSLKILNLFLTLPPTPAPIAANPPPPPPPLYADVLSTKIPPFPPPPSAADGVPLPRLYPPALPPPTTVLPPTPDESVTQSIPAPLPISVRLESLPAPPLMCVASPFVVAADDDPRKKLLRFPAPPSSLSSRWWWYPLTCGTGGGGDDVLSFLLLYLPPPRKLRRAPRPWRMETGLTVLTSSVAAAWVPLVSGEVKEGCLWWLPLSGGERGQVGVGEGVRAGWGWTGMKKASSGA